MNAMAESTRSAEISSQLLNMQFKELGAKEESLVFKFEIAEQIFATGFGKSYVFI